MTGLIPATPRTRWVIGLTSWGLLMACSSCGLFDFLTPCAQMDADATITVDGVYRYSARTALIINGTITFESDGSTVRVTNTTDDSGSNRALEGVAELEGNTLSIILFPINGDTDYQADVTFVFSEGGDRFCVSFSDTNDDAGDLGSFVGVRER